MLVSTYVLWKYLLAKAENQSGIFPNFCKLILLDIRKYGT